MLTAIKGEINSHTIIVGGFNTPLIPMDRSPRQKINQETQTLNDTTGQTDLIDTQSIFHPKATEYTFFSITHRKFFRIDHILGHKSSLSKFKTIEIVSNMFSDYNTMRLEVSCKEKKL